MSPWNILLTLLGWILIVVSFVFVLAVMWGLIRSFTLKKTKTDSPKKILASKFASDASTYAYTSIHSANQDKAFIEGAEWAWKYLMGEEIHDK